MTALTIYDTRKKACAPREQRVASLFFAFILPCKKKLVHLQVRRKRKKIRRKRNMKKDFNIKTATDKEVISVVEGMLNAKKEWLESVRKREKELGIA